MTLITGQIAPAAGGQHEPGNAAHRIQPSYKFSELEDSIRKAGLLQKQPTYYFFRTIIVVGIVGLALAMIILNADNALRWIGAALLAAAFGQVGYLMHDLGHGQVFEKQRLNAIAGAFFGNIVLGISTEWWRGNHNRHHGHPNQVGLDPDISYPVFVFAEEQAHHKTGLTRWIVKHQVYFFPLAISLVPISMRKDSLQLILFGRSKAPVREITSLALHYCWFVGGAFWLLAPANAILLLMFNQILFGIVLGTTFAPNHKGMPLVGEHEDLDFVTKQIVTARNIVGGRLVDLWYGGLNFQIEHHLFPHMPCNNLRKSQEIVAPFCHRHGLPYVATSSMESYRQALRHIHEVVKSLRT